MSGCERLVNINIALLEQGISFLERVDPRLYADQSEQIGKQIRHVGDFYAGFLDGYISRQVDFTERPRNPEYEGNPGKAKEYFAVIMGRLEGLRGADGLQRVFIKEELAINDFEDVPHTMASALAYLRSHTIHHYAIVKKSAGILGYEVDDQTFGVNPSTLRAEECAHSEPN